MVYHKGNALDKELVNLQMLNNLLLRFLLINNIPFTITERPTKYFFVMFLKKNFMKLYKYMYSVSFKMMMLIRQRSWSYEFLVVKTRKNPLNTLICLFLMFRHSSTNIWIKFIIFIYPFRKSQWSKLRCRKSGLDDFWRSWPLELQCVTHKYKPIFEKKDT